MPASDSLAAPDADESAATDSVDWLVEALRQMVPAQARVKLWSSQALLVTTARCAAFRAGVVCAQASGEWPPSCVPALLHVQVHDQHNTAAATGNAKHIQAMQQIGRL